MSNALHVNLANNRWALKVLFNPLNCSSSSTYVIQTIPSSRTNRPQTIIEINSARPNENALLVVRQHFLCNTRATILQLNTSRTVASDDHHPILTADIIAQTIDASMIDHCSSPCSICLGDFHLTESLLQLTCQHVYHRECLLQWLQTHHRCPYCRFVVYQQPVTPHVFLIR